MPIDVVEVHDWYEFGRAVSRISGHCIYRGHANPSWKLSSQWERWLLRLEEKKQLARNIWPDKSDEEIEALNADSRKPEVRDSFLLNFRRLATGIPGLDSRALGDDENAWWALGRHHGLVTPLLDWTRSPYVAAFFAFFDLMAATNPGFQSGLPVTGYNIPHGPVAIWALWIHEELQSDEFALVEVRKDNFYRQRAQEGLFTKLTAAGVLDLESYLTSRDLTQLLSCIKVTASADDVLNDLQRMNIKLSTLFPDLDGAARQANLRHSYVRGLL